MENTSRVSMAAVSNALDTSHEYRRLLDPRVVNPRTAFHVVPGAPIVFAGITINPVEVTATVAAETRPPVKRGDLDRLGSGTVVAIIEGELSENAAVPINEIRRALDRGVKISGAASVGALCAYEARTEGMTGIGWVYDAYCTGRITGTDEIAVLYDPISFGPLTIPLLPRLSESCARDHGQRGGECHEIVEGVEPRRARRPNHIAAPRRRVRPNPSKRAATPSCACRNRHKENRRMRPAAQLGSC